MLCATARFLHAETWPSAQAPAGILYDCKRGVRITMLRLWVVQSCGRCDWLIPVRRVLAYSGRQRTTVRALFRCARQINDIVKHNDTTPHIYEQGLVSKSASFIVCLPFHHTARCRTNRAEGLVPGPYQLSPQRTFVTRRTGGSTSQLSDMCSACWPPHVLAGTVMRSRLSKAT